MVDLENKIGIHAKELTSSMSKLDVHEKEIERSRNRILNMDQRHAKTRHHSQSTSPQPEHTPQQGREHQVVRLADHITPHRTKASAAQVWVKAGGWRGPKL